MKCGKVWAPLRWGGSSGIENFFGKWIMFSTSVGKTNRNLKSEGFNG